MSRENLEGDAAKIAKLKEAQVLTASGDYAKAESLLLEVGEIDAAINMYMKAREFDSGIRLVDQYRHDWLCKTHVMIARMVEKEGNYSRAEHHYVQGLEWSKAVTMYRTRNLLDDANRVSREAMTRFEENWREARVKLTTEEDTSFANLSKRAKETIYRKTSILDLKRGSRASTTFEDALQGLSPKARAQGPQTPVAVAAPLNLNSSFRLRTLEDALQGPQDALMGSLSPTGRPREASRVQTPLVGSMSSTSTLRVRTLEDALQGSPK